MIYTSQSFKKKALCFPLIQKTPIAIHTWSQYHSLISLFANYEIFLDLFLQASLIDQMDWRASQPLNHLLSKELQWSDTSQIGFCGDWFDLNSCRGVESAMNSSLRLVKSLNRN